MSYNPIGRHTADKSVSVVFASDQMLSEVTPTAYTTVSDTFADVAGSTLDMAYYTSLAYTCKNTGAQTIKWQVLGANAADFSDAVVVQASAPITAGSIGNYTVAQALYRYYKVQAADNVNGAHGQATVRGIAKV